MLKRLIVTLLFAPVAGMLAMSSAYAALTLSGNGGAPGQPLSVTVSIDVAANTVQGFSFEMTYDPAVLQFDGYSAAALLSGFDSVAVTEPAAGVLRLGGFMAASSPIQLAATGHLFVLSFTPLLQGITTLALQNLTDDMSAWNTTGISLSIMPDADGDGVADAFDAFPTDPAASVDSDGDGYPDSWNAGKTAIDSTTGLILDAFPNDPLRWIQAQQDTAPPVITLLGQSPVTVAQGAVYTDAGATATDAVDGDLTVKIVVNNAVNTSTIGTYTVAYDVTDAAGNAATQVTRTVNVVAANTISQTYNLTSGWNLISFPMDLGATGLTDFLAAVPEATSVWSFLNGGWQSFIVGTSAFLNSLNLLEAGKGYWVQLPAGVTKTVTLNGPPVSVTPNLVAASGWNLIGVTTPVTDMAGFISGTGAASVWTFANGQWQSFVAGTPVFLNSLQGMDVGAGYYVNMQ